MDIVRFLRCEVTGLHPEGKFVLVRLLMKYQADGGFSRTVQDLADDIGIRAPSIAKALAALEAHKLLSVSSVSNGRGRPVRRFLFTAHLKASLSKVSLPDGYTPACSVERLVETGSDGTDADIIHRPDWTDGILHQKRKVGRLSVTNRLLVAVMMTAADRLGVVNSLGLADLRGATGLSKERLIYRLSRLVAIGVIRCRIPGATGHELFGLAKSTYVFNLADPELAVLDLKPTVIVKPLLATRPSSWCSLGESVYVSANQPHNPGLVSEDERRSLHRLLHVRGYFDRRDRGQISLTLEFKLLFYASLLLSNHRELVPTFPADFPAQEPSEVLFLQDRFRRDFPSAETAGLASILELHACLWEAVCRKAIEIQKLLNRTYLPLEGEWDFLVLPVPLQAPDIRYLTVLALPKAEPTVTGCYIFGGDAALPKRFPSETEMDVSSRLDYGLLSGPGPRAGGYRE